MSIVNHGFLVQVNIYQKNLSLSPHKYFYKMGIWNHLAKKGSGLQASVSSLRLIEDDSLLFLHGLRIITHLCVLANGIGQTKGLEHFLLRVRSAESLMAFLDPIYTIKEVYSLVSMILIALHCQKSTNVCVHSISWKAVRQEGRLALEKGTTFRDTVIRLAYYSTRLIAETLSSAIYLFEKGIESAFGRWQMLMRLISQILVLLLHVLRKMQSKTLIRQSTSPLSLLLCGSKPNRRLIAPVKSSILQSVSLPLVKDLFETFSCVAELYTREKLSLAYASVVNLAKIGADLISFYLLRGS